MILFGLYILSVVVTLLVLCNMPEEIAPPCMIMMAAFVPVINLFLIIVAVCMYANYDPNAGDSVVKFFYKFFRFRKD